MLKKSKTAIIHTDGGARGNPGPAGIGVVIQCGNQLKKYKKFIGKKTNNQAEYEAVIFALEKAKALGCDELLLYIDSELIVNQLKRKYRVKDGNLAALFLRVWNLSQQFQKVSFHHIHREENTVADRLVNEAIDEFLKK